MKLVYEVNGSDALSKEWMELENSGIGLGMAIYAAQARGAISDAKSLAKEHGVPLSDVTLRFVEG